MNGYLSAPFIKQASPPSWLGGLASYASPQEWSQYGTMFAQNPQMLAERYKFSQIGKEVEQAKILDKQAEIQRSMFKPSEYTAQLKQQREFEKAQRDYDMRRLQFQNQALDWKRGMMGRFGFGGFSGSSQGGMGSREYSPQSRLAPTPMVSQPSWMNSYFTPRFPA